MQEPSVLGMKSVQQELQVMSSYIQSSCSFPPRWVNAGQPPFFILLIRAHPPMCGQESLGTLWENVGLWEN